MLVPIPFGLNLMERTRKGVGGEKSVVEQDHDSYHFSEKGGEIFSPSALGEVFVNRKME